MLTTLLGAALLAGCGDDKTGLGGDADKAPHTLTEEGGSPSFDSDTIKGGQQGSVTFSKPGTFKYFCAFHATMKGTVTVTR